MAGKVSTKYHRRIKAIRPVTKGIRIQVAATLDRALHIATEMELYSRTSLPVTYKMYNSIGSRITGEMVEVGYNIAKSNAPYASRRVNMRGESTIDGHNLEMHPAVLVRMIADPVIAKLIRRAHKGILDGNIIRDMGSIATTSQLERIAKTGPASAFNSKQLRIRESYAYKASRLGR